MRTAAGTISAAKCFVVGVGVAGLQAIATARRLGAQVSATDVRSATKEQIQSLGAKPIFVESVAGIEGEGAKPNPEGVNKVEEDLFLAFEVEVEGSLGDAGGAGDLGDAGAVVSPLAEDQLGSFEDLLACRLPSLSGRPK